MSPASASRGWVVGRIGRAPVVVSPTSLLLGLLIAGSWYPLVSAALSDFGPLAVLTTVLATVVGVGLGVLLHELAHGLAGTVLGRRPVRYELYLWGGRTTFGPARSWAPWKDVVTSLAGPAANLALWAVGRALIAGDVVSSVPLGVAVWALTWVNLALAVFNALPGLPLDGGHALSALVAQVTGRPQWGRRAAAVGGLFVVAAIAWWWILVPLTHGTRPDSFSLVLAIMVAWPIASTSWQVLQLSGGRRSAAALDLRTLARPVVLVQPGTTVAGVRAELDAGAAVVLVADESGPVGMIDSAGLAELALPADSEAVAGEICTTVPNVALSNRTTGQEAAEALKAARTVSRWLILVEGGRVSGAVPTGAR